MKNHIFYRYRPVEIIKDNYIKNKDGKIEEKKGKTIVDEILNNEMFFASIKENNDPIDGKLIVFFEGDSIVWKCFLRNYCFSLLNLFQIISVIGDKQELEDDEFKKYINPIMTKERQEMPLYKETFKNIFENFLLDKSVQEITQIINSKKKLYSQDLENIFWFINKIFLFYMKEYLKKTKFSFISELIKINSIDFINKLDWKENFNDFEKVFKTIIRLTKNSDIRISLFQDDIQEQKKYKKNIIQANFNFNKKYFELLLDLHFNEYYISCFSKYPNVDLLWSHYAEKHKGVCLIFELDSDFTMNFLKLKDSNFVPERIKLEKVNYNSKNLEINFFDYLGIYPIQLLINTWFLFNDEYSLNLNIYKEKDKFHKNYWNKFQEKSVLKSLDWKYENEYRLVKSNMFDKIDTSARLLRYHQDHLVGIIFGENTDIELKKQLIQNMKVALSSNKFNKFQWKECVRNPVTKKLEIISLNFGKLIT